MLSVADPPLPPVVLAVVKAKVAERDVVSVSVSIRVIAQHSNSILNEFCVTAAVVLVNTVVVATVDDITAVVVA